MTDIDREFVTAANAAAMLGVPKRTLLYWLSRGIVHGTLVGSRLWLMPRAEIEGWDGRERMTQGGRSLPTVSKSRSPSNSNQVDGPDAAAIGSGPGEPDT